MTPPYKALREAVPDLSQRQVERDLGWKRGRLSVIERGLVPTDDERRQLLGYYAERMQQEAAG